MHRAQLNSLGFMNNFKLRGMFHTIRLQVWLVTQQMTTSGTQSQMSNTAMLMISPQTVLDAFLCLLHLSLGKHLFARLWISTSKQDLILGRERDLRLIQTLLTTLAWRLSQSLSSGTRGYDSPSHRWHNLRQGCTLYPGLGSEMNPGGKTELVILTHLWPIPLNFDLFRSACFAKAPDRPTIY